MFQCSVENGSMSSEYQKLMQLIYGLVGMWEAAQIPL